MQGGDYNNNVCGDGNVANQKVHGPIASGDMTQHLPPTPCAIHGHSNNTLSTPLAFATPQKKYATTTSTPQRNRYYSPQSSPQVAGYGHPNSNRVQTLPQLQQQAPPPKDMNSAIKDMFARKGICLEHSTKLGSGRYSKVITAQTLSGGTIAIKMINKRMVTPEFRHKFLPREISCWKRLKHSNIVQICGHYEALGFVFLLMEYGSGGDMLSHVQHNGPVAENQAGMWMREISSAVRYMHDNDMAHRDLKLENIVLFGRHVKISDFGFSRKVNNELSYTFCGSKSYSAPEILLGAAYNPFKADVWSLGVIAYVICTDLMPYRENCSNNKIVEAQKNRSYSFPSKLNLSPACKTAIDEMMTFDANARPSVHQVMNMDWIAAIRASQLRQREQQSHGNNVVQQVSSSSGNPMVHRHQTTHQHQGQHHYTHQPYPSPHHSNYTAGAPTTPRTPSMPIRTPGGAANMMFNLINQQQGMATPQNSAHIQIQHQQSNHKQTINMGPSSSRHSAFFPTQGNAHYGGFAPQGYENVPPYGK